MVTNQRYLEALYVRYVKPWVRETVSLGSQNINWMKSSTCMYALFDMKQRVLKEIIKDDQQIPTKTPSPQKQKIQQMVSADSLESLIDAPADKQVAPKDEKKEEPPKQEKKEDKPKEEPKMEETKPKEEKKQPELVSTSAGTPTTEQYWKRSNQGP